MQPQRLFGKHRELLVGNRVEVDAGKVVADIDHPLADALLVGHYPPAYKFTRTLWRVVLSSETGPILGAVAVVYMLPLVLLLTGCVLAGLWGALAGILLSAAGIVVIERCRGKKTVYTVTDFAPDRADV